MDEPDDVAPDDYPPRTRRSLRFPPKDAFVFPVLGALSCKVLLVASKRATLPTIAKITGEEYVTVHACVKRLLSAGYLKLAGKAMGLNSRPISAYRATDDGLRAFRAYRLAAEAWLEVKMPEDIKTAVTTFWVRPPTDDDLDDFEPEQE